MHRDIDYIKLKEGGDWDIECIKHNGVDPIKALSMAIYEPSGPSDTESLGIILHEKILELSERIDKLYEQQFPESVKAA